MALQSEVSPHLVGDPNKDTQIEGDTKSDDDSSQSTDEDVDLEEGEILDSSAEEEEKEKKDLTNSSLQEALDKNMLKSIEQLVSQAKSDTPTPVPITNKSVSPHTSPHKIKKRSSKYLDHDRFENSSDHDDGWFSPSRKSKSSKYDGKPIDYRKELEAYRGTPPSSPDSKHREKKRKRSSKKSKKSGKKTIKRKDIKGVRVSKYVKESMRTRLCKFFKDGNCAKGADCAYSHASPHAFKKKEICKFYLSGYCNKGNDCIYMHDEFPCKFYHTGSECYAKDACRFSHSPLNEEMKQILADYLRCSRGDDDYDRKRRCSPSPSPERKGPPPGPPPKRTCLLGSPPRHIREAEETKRWQEEMLHHQHENPAFKIHVSPSRDNTSSPPPFPNRPNFYQETLPSTPSPKRRRNAEATNNSLSTSFPPPPPSGHVYETYSRSSPSDNFVYEEDYQDLDDEVINIKQEPPEVPEFSWNNMRGMDHNLPPIKTEVEPYVDSTQQDLDFTSDVKFDETTQFSEMESSIECSASSPPNSAFHTTAVNKEIGGESPNNEGIVKSEDKNNDDSNSAQETVTTPIIIPSHLPKKQQELFKRIFQHQKKTAMTASASDASNSPKHYDNTESLEKETEDVKEKPEVEKSEQPLWYSSEEDDDDDSDEPLTDVLKKLQKEPPSVKPPVKTEPKPATDIMALLTKVKQNTVEKNKGAPESQQSEFIKNLLSGKILSGSNVQPTCTPISEPRRTLLPDPQISIKKEPMVAPKDPRLKNRDPRVLTTSANSVLNLPKTLEQSILQTSSVITQDNKISTFSSSVTSVITETVKEDIPYKLRGIYTKPPNYTPYINASQSNPNLLKDPRLRKHLNLNPNNENGIEVKKSDVPPIPKLLLAYDKFEPINIFESSSTSKPVVEESQDVKSLRSKLIDPRMKRRDSQNSSGSNTPPHLTAVDNLSPSFSKTNSFENEAKIKEEKKWSPPLLEKAWNPPVVEHIENTIKQEVDSDTDDPLRLEIDENPPASSKDSEDNSPNFVKKSTPTPASHLPRAIADPRMARLHGPLDSRRLRSFESSVKNIELKRNSPPKENVTDASKTSPPGNTAAEADVVKIGKNIPKKKTNKSEEKKKTIHRNRKSSMDYASPLNSCDDSNSNKSLNYNSYNLRPQRASSSYAVPDSSNSTNSVISESTPDFLSDNSNLDCDNSSDGNLKDKFKTIDPTASPFC